MKEFNRDGRVLQFGYVLQWPDGTLQAYSFASNRHDSWASICTDSEEGRIAKKGWQKVGVRCVRARNTIAVEGAG